MTTVHLAAVSVESRCFDIASLVGQLAAGSGSSTVVAMCFLCSTVYASTIAIIVLWILRPLNRLIELLLDTTVPHPHSGHKVTQKLISPSSSLQPIPVPTRPTLCLSLSILTPQISTQKPPKSQPTLTPLPSHTLL